LNTLKGPDERIRIPGFYDRVLPPSEEDLDLLRQLPEMSDEYRRIYGIETFLKGLEGGLELQREAIFSPTCTICGLTSGYQGPLGPRPSSRRMPAPRWISGWCRSRTRKKSS